MSVRTEPRDLSQQLQQTLTIPADVMAAAGQQQAAPVGAPAAGTELVPAEQQLHEANTFNTNNEHHPLERTVCVNIRASLADLCLKSQAATWSPPSAEATKSIFQQARLEPATRTATLPPSPGQAQAQAQAKAASSIERATGPDPTGPDQPHTPSRTLR
jgi:hypothetical protein